jgi:hypothetical protein
MRRLRLGEGLVERAQGGGTGEVLVERARKCWWKRGSDKAGSKGAWAPTAGRRGLVAAARIRGRFRFAAIESAGSSWCGDNERQNTCRDQHRFDG